VLLLLLYSCADGCRSSSNVEFISIYAFFSTKVNAETSHPRKRSEERFRKDAGFSHVMPEP
jgi:hypothetical protein